MYDRLAGRLTWERTVQGIRVEIPARLNWTIGFLFVWLVGWTAAGGFFLQKISDPAMPWHFRLVWSAFWIVAEAFAVSSIVWSLSGRFTLALDSSSLEITRRAAGIKLSGQSYRTSDVHNLRFVPATGGGRTYTVSQIRFEANDKSHGFGSGIDDNEAAALIGKMLEIYPFPKDRALEYFDYSPR